MSRRALLFGLPRRLVREGAAEMAATTRRREVEPQVNRSELRPHSKAGIDGLLQQLGTRAGAAERAPTAPERAGRQEDRDG